MIKKYTAVYSLLFVLFSFRFVESVKKKYDLGFRAFPVVVLKNHKKAVSSVSFSSDGKYLVSASDDHTVRVWCARTFKQIRVLECHKNLVNSAVFSSDSSYVLSASADKTVLLWNIKDNKKIEIKHGNFVKMATFIPRSGGKRFVSVTEDDGEAFLSSINEKKVVKTKKIRDESAGFDDDNFFYKLGLSPDGKQAVSVNNDEIVRLWNIAANKCIKKLIGHRGFVASAAFSPNGKQVVSADDCGVICLWNAEIGRCKKFLESHDDEVCSVEFSPDGRLIVSASFDNTVRVWSVNAGKCLIVLKGHTDCVNSATISPCGKYLVSASDDKTIRVWLLARLEKIENNKFSDMRLFFK